MCGLNAKGVHLFFCITRYCFHAMNFYNIVAVNLQLLHAFIYKYSLERHLCLRFPSQAARLLIG